MKRTQKNLLHLYSDITEYARAKIHDYGLPTCDAGDIVNAAYLHAQEKLRGVKVRKDRAAVIKNIAWCEVMNELERRNRLRNAMLREAVRLDAPPRDNESKAESGPDDELGSYDVTDGGEGAMRIRRHDASEEPDVPDWVYAVRLQESKEAPGRRKVITRLKRDMFREEIMTELKLSRRQFYEIMKIFKLHFDQCFRAYHRYLVAKFAEQNQIRLVYSIEGRDDGDVPSQESLTSRNQQ